MNRVINVFTTNRFRPPVSAAPDAPLKIAETYTFDETVPRDFNPVVHTERGVQCGEADRKPGKLIWRFLVMYVVTTVTAVVYCTV